MSFEIIRVMLDSATDLMVFFIFQDVFGAAETGSGKTLAFGLPILQRLLEEREKAEKLIAETGEAHERIVSRGYLRALIITPTRELAKQVPISILFALSDPFLCHS